MSQVGGAANAVGNGSVWSIWALSPLLPSRSHPPIRPPACLIVCLSPTLPVCHTLFALHSPFSSWTQASPSPELWGTPVLRGLYCVNVHTSHCPTTQGALKLGDAEREFEGAERSLTAARLRWEMGGRAERSLTAARLRWEGEVGGEGEERARRTRPGRGTAEMGGRGRGRGGGAPLAAGRPRRGQRRRIHLRPKCTAPSLSCVLPHPVVLRSLPAPRPQSDLRRQWRR